MGQLDRFFIPKQIKVGYNERSNTYTGKLGYVIYYDQKNVLRKERSWQSWRQDNLGFNDYPNEPLEGFVLNKHVGGYKSDWNFRQSYCRIYDPRGFEFEITIENLLWILDWEDCMHGKGLTGKYVYGWIGDQLVLIPCCTDDYKVSQEYSDRMFNESNLKTKDLVPGASYKVKNETTPYIFIGNLKVQKFLGKGYTTKSFFICANKDDSSKWSRRNNENTSLYALNKSSILCKIADNIITQEEIDELVYRFNLTAYSYEFWNTTNNIEKFMHCNDDIALNKKLFEHEHWDYENEKKNYNRIALISEDGKSVSIVKPYYHSVERIGGYSYYRSYNIVPKGYYKFIDLTADMQITKYNDMGHAAHNNSYWYDRGEKAENDIYKDHGDDTFVKLTFVDRDDAFFKTNEYGTLYYQTKDGYISDSLQQLIKKESLSYKSQIITEEVNCILLPVKLPEENNGNK
jgi:hypothetical protein